MARQLFTNPSITEAALSGSAFIGGDSSAAAASMNSHVQLFNPVASGAKLIVSQVYVRPSSATPTMRLTRHNAALTNLATTVGNKFLGGADPVGEIRNQVSGTILGTLLHFFRVPGTTAVDIIEFGPEIIIPPGIGLIVVSATQNEAVTAGFEWTEISG